MYDEDGNHSLLALLVVFIAFTGIAAGATLMHTTAVTQNDDGTVLNQPGGPAINMTGNTEVSNESGDINSTAIRWVTTDGNLTAVSSGNTEATVDVTDFDATWTNVTRINATAANLTLSTESKADATVGGNVTALSYQTSAGIAANDGATDFVYSADGPGTITLRNLPASSTFRAATVDGTDLGTVSTDASGTATISVEPGTDQSVVFFDVDAPNLADITATPGDGGQLNSSSVTLSIDVTDADFATRQGDSVEVTFFVDGSQVGTDTLTSNGTATTTTTITEGGSHTWSAEATDTYGGSGSSQTFDISVPSTLFIRAENDPDTLVNATDVQITAYYSQDEVQRRTVTNGKLNLTGFPVDQPIIVRANATNYTARTAVVESIYEQNSIYLLNESVTQNLIRFQLQQVTGDFPDDSTVLFVERDIALNGTVEWRTVAGDNFGVSGVPIYLRQDERYRLRIKNLETSETAVIGAFTPIQSETVTLSAGSAQVNVDDFETPYGYNITQEENPDQIVVEYEDTANETERIRIVIHERFNESNVLVNTTYYDSNSLIHQESLTANESNVTWMAELYVDRGNGWMHFRVPISGGPTSLIPATLDSVWLNAAGVFIMLIGGLAFSKLNLGVGAVSTALVGGLLWWLGLLGGVATGAGVVAAIAIAVVYHYRSQQGGVTA